MSQINNILNNIYEHDYEYHIQKLENIVYKLKNVKKEKLEKYKNILENNWTEIQGLLNNINTNILQQKLEEYINTKNIQNEILKAVYNIIVTHIVDTIRFNRRNNDYEYVIFDCLTIYFNGLKLTCNTYEFNDKNKISLAANLRFAFSKYYNKTLNRKFMLDSKYDYDLYEFIKGIHTVIMS